MIEKQVARLMYEGKVPLEMEEDIQDSWNWNRLSMSELLQNVKRVTEIPFIKFKSNGDRKYNFCVDTLHLKKIT